MTLPQFESIDKEFDGAIERTTISSHWPANLTPTPIRINDKAENVRVQNIKDSKSKGKHVLTSHINQQGNAREASSRKGSIVPRTKPNTDTDSDIYTSVRPASKNDRIVKLHYLESNVTSYGNKNEDNEFKVTVHHNEDKRSSRICSSPRIRSARSPREQHRQQHELGGHSRVPHSILKGTSTRMRSVYPVQAEVNPKKRRKDNHNFDLVVQFTAETIRLHEELGYGKWKSRLREKKLEKWKFLN